MGFSTWLKQGRLKRIETKLKSLRTRQKHVRKKEDDLARDRKAGAVPSTEAEERARRLHDEKEKLTHEINLLVAEEERVRGELAREGALAAR